jgi:triosephosphate isomerase (TIM)
MRKKIVAGNWKMNKTFPEAIALIDEIYAGIAKAKLCNSAEKIIIIAPPFPYLQYAGVGNTSCNSIALAGQNCHTSEKGAFTGEVSASMLYSIGARYVIIGHSERRNYFKESDEFLALKVITAIKAGLKPIFCCGELLSERQSGSQFEVVKRQLKEGVFHLDEEVFANVVIAYEPVWAIGTGVNATPAQAQEMHAYIRQLIAENYTGETANNTSLLYGGSCNAQNAAELFANPDVDGGLIGGASLTAKDFLAIVNSF